MRRWLIAGGTVYSPYEKIDQGAVLIHGGKILAVGTRDALCTVVPAEMILDAGGFIIAPGLVDLQVNGGFGHDFTSDPASIPDVARRLPECGVTAFLPTLVSPLRETAFRAGEVLDKSIACIWGAKPLGLHLEGPYLNPRRAGAHDRVRLLSPEQDEAGAWMHTEPLNQHIRLVTLAPELHGSMSLIRRLLSQGIIVSLGHSDASYEQAVEAFDAGVPMVTHLFNAMPAWHHRLPGLIGAALDDPRVRVSLIVDGVHLHPASVRLALKAKGKDSIILVSDAAAAMGMAGGTATLAGREVQVDEGRRAVRLADGTLAGSSLSLHSALRRLWDIAEIDRGDALASASRIPALAIGLGQRKGLLEPGFDADILIMDSEWRVVGTVVAGEWAFRNPNYLSEGARWH